MTNIQPYNMIQYSKYQLTVSLQVLPFLALNSIVDLLSSLIPPNQTTALLFLYTSGGISQLTGNYDSLHYFGKMLAYSWEVEISRQLDTSFAITWKILEVMILELLLNTNCF